MPENFQTYDPRQLVEDVFALLTEKGLSPDGGQGDPLERQAAAGMLLRNFGVVPTVAPETWLDLDGQLGYNRVVHGD
ncbi:hypothetical protein GCM10022243_63540 [Saccharothrix violaceirubra]|uniref:hypothetical protein n=1 Tax=Saccharothrix violaceirubra TaxID=413306 RepID=UPI0031EA8963